MSEWNMLVWLTQLGLSIVVPLAAFTGGAVWLRSRYALGVWVVFLGLFFGLLSAVYSFRLALKEMESMNRRTEEANSRKRRTKQE